MLRLLFFIVSEIYEWYPELIECIRDNGHEIGFHTRSHKIVNCSGDIARELAQSETFIRIFEPKDLGLLYCAYKTIVFRFYRNMDSSMIHHSTILNQLKVLPMVLMKYLFRFSVIES